MMMAVDSVAAFSTGLGSTHVVKRSRTSSKLAQRMPAAHGRCHNPLTPPHSLAAHPPCDDDETAAALSSRLHEFVPQSLPILTCSSMTAWFIMASHALPVLAAAAEDGEVVLETLPPPYVPALFGVGLLVGVGLLTSSLGNVMDEEASLGLQSGAQAKKEIERSRSSYFKKKK
ncbi:hypothetical protein ACA910_002861 [Epithemia clementina (nom. ined.)]